MPTNPFGSFEDAFEQGVSTVKQQIKQQASTTAKSTASQVTGTTIVNDSAKVGNVDATKPLQDQFNETATNQQQNPQDPAQQQAMQQLEAKDLQERQKKLAEARQRLMQLHKQTYYDPTFNRKRQVPTVQERLEQEKQVEEQKKMEDLEEKKKKETPVALRQAQNKAEIYRGASG